MALTLGNLDSRFGRIVGNTAASDLADRLLFLGDADVKLSRVKGFWRVREFDYTTTSTPAMAADQFKLDVPTTAPIFETPYRLYYRESGFPRFVLFKSRSEWLENSHITDTGYPQTASLFQEQSKKRIDLNRKLSSGFVSNVGTLTLEYFIEITRLSAAGDQSILPDSLRDHIIAVAGYQWALSQGDDRLIRNFKEDSILAEAEVRAYDVTHIARARQIRPTFAYAPEGDSILADDYQFQED